MDFKQFFSKGKELNLFGKVFSFLFPFTIMLGYSFSHTNSWDLLFKDNLLLTICNLLIIIVAGFMVMNCVALLIEKLHSIKVSAAGTDEKLPIHPSCISTLVIIAGWLPIIIAHLPGSVPYDGMTQLLEHFGQIPHYGHHPVFITRLYGIIVQIGASIISENFGVFLVVLFQAVLCVSVYSAVCTFILKNTGSKALWIVSMLFYGLFPVFGFYVSAVLKDTFYLAVATWFSLCICRAVTEFQKSGTIFSSSKDVFFCIFSGILMCLSRKEATVCVIVSLFFLLFAIRKNLSLVKKVLVIAAVIIVFNSGFNFVVFNIIGIQKGEISEALSIPFQQTARFVRDYPDEVTEDEKAAIAAILPYDQLSDIYDPELSDPIKGKMQNESGMSGYIGYAKAWLKMGLRKPGVYVEATLNNTYGYFYPLYKGKDVMFSSISHSQAERWGGKELDIYYIFNDSAFKNNVVSFYKSLQSIPVLGLLFNPGFYFWILVLAITYCVQYKTKLSAVLLALPVTTFLISFASPANGFGRYVLVVYATIILDLLICYLSAEKDL